MLEFLGDTNYIQHSSAFAYLTVKSYSLQLSV